MSAVIFSSIRDEYGFLSTSYPAPFELEQARWRTVEHYYQGMRTSDEQRRIQIRQAISASEAIKLANDASTPIRLDFDTILSTQEATKVASLINVPNVTMKDMIMLQGIIAKFKANPELISKIQATAPSPIIYKSNDTYWGSGTIPIGNMQFNGKNMLGRLLQYVRDNVIVTRALTDGDSNILFDNLYSILYDQGYKTFQFGTSAAKPIAEAPRVDYIGMVIKGEISSEESAIETNPARKKKKEKEAIVDVFIQGTYKDDRLTEVINANKHKEERPIYFIIAYLTKGNINKVLRAASFFNIRFFSPAELYVRPSQHMLAPAIERVSPSDPIYEFLHKMEGKLPEISSGDKLLKEKGIRPGEFIWVNDMSPHYRYVV